MTPARIAILMAATVASRMRVALALLCVVGAASPTTAAPTPTPTLTAPTSVAAPDDDVQLLSGLIVAELARNHGVAVVSSADLRTQLDLEGQRQAAGCGETSASCLAEVAGAMGTHLVVSGSVGRLGSDLTLTLSLFDSTTGTSPGRVVVRAPTVDALTRQVPQASADLLGHLGTPRAGAARQKILVLDLTGTIDEAPVADQGPSTGLVVSGAGAGIAVLGAGLLTASGILHLVAEDATTTQRAADEAYGLRDVGGWAGSAGVVVGATVLVVGATMSVME